MKTLTASDLVVGKKYVPHSKTAIWNEPLSHSTHWSSAKRKNQPYLFYSGPSTDLEKYRFSCDPNSSGGDYFSPSDVTEYQEPNQTTMNTEFAEQPFNLETALKHPEWVRTRDGREIDFIKEYAERANGCNVLYVTKEGTSYAVDIDGTWQSNSESDNDLILRVPYREIWVNINPHSLAYWYDNKELADHNARKNRIACVPVKIPANS